MEDRYTYSKNLKMFLSFEGDKKVFIDQSETKCEIFVRRDDSDKCLFITFDPSKSDKHSIDILNKAIAENIKIDSIMYCIYHSLWFFVGQEAETCSRFDTIMIHLPIGDKIEMIKIFPTADPKMN